MEDLEAKYIALLRAEIPCSILPGSTKETQCLRGVPAIADSKPIVFFNNLEVAKRYKKAKLSKGKDGWFAWFEYRHPQTGEWKPFSRKLGINRIKSVREKKEHAEALVNSLNKLLKDGWGPFGYIGPVNELREKTLFDCLTHLLKFRVEPLIKKGSEKKYSDVVKIFKTWLEESGNRFIFPNEFDESHAIAFSDYMTINLGHAGKTHNVHKGNLSWFFNRMKAKKIITDNPIALIPKRTENQQVRIAFTEAERKILKADFAANNPLLGEFCQCMYFLGLRPKELLLVQLRDIFIDERKIMIYTGTSKNRRQEPVYMSEAMIGMIVAKQIENFPGHFYLFGHSLKISDKKWGPDSVGDLHREMTRRLKIDERHKLYSWKDTGAKAFYYANGRDPYKLMKHLRHTSIVTTMKYIRSLGMDYNAEIQVPAF